MTGQPTRGSKTLTDGAAPDSDNQTKESTKIQKGILKSLVDNVEAGTEVKRLLAAYKPTVKYETNLKALLKFDEAVVEESATYLGAKPRNQTGDKRYKSKKSLTDWIIMAIEGLFPQFCAACDSNYTIKRGEEPRFRCSSCGGGSHDCAAITDHPLMKIPGFSWTCFGCTAKNTLETFTELDKGEVSPPRSAASQQNEESLRRKFSFVDIDVIVGTSNNERKNEDTADTIPICPLYLQGRCRHGHKGTKKVGGKACNKSHPPLCRKYCAHGTMKKYGCSEGTKCRYHHPPICKQSQLKHECLKSDCKLRHLRNTRRSVEKTVLKPEPPTTALPTLQYSQALLPTLPAPELPSSQDRSPQPSGDTSAPVTAQVSRESFLLERLVQRLERLEGWMLEQFRDQQPNRDRRRRTR